MVDKSILKSVEFFEEFSDEMVERLAKLAELRQYQEGEYLNKKRRSADYLYIILEGVVALELEDITGKMIRLETLFDGAALGFSSLVEIEPKRYLTDARVLTPTKALRFRPADLDALCYQDFHFGFLLMKKTTLIARQRLLYRTLPIDHISKTKQTPSR